MDITIKNGKLIEVQALVMTKSTFEQFPNVESITPEPDLKIPLEIIGWVDDSNEIRRYLVKYDNQVFKMRDSTLRSLVYDRDYTAIAAECKDNSAITVPRAISNRIREMLKNTEQVFLK